MKTAITTLETTAIVSENRQQLLLESALPIYGSKRVRVIVLYEADGSELNEVEWLQAVASNPAFDFLNDPAEDIYSLSDGDAAKEAF